MYKARKGKTHGEQYQEWIHFDQERWQQGKGTQGTFQQSNKHGRKLDQ